ncbi:murein DD-endopeptidase MepM/ murein hydrolase activator NlpD [Roseinatronobacter thiooxidans]|uniref:Murein DD-endopeptidase MepM/ murein hydrolase activator NlpD n=1 Tax=Roseinatronobacter thiooxidans TaxID=121821 RepID=A0A2W7S7Y3_9RHOB|nr:LysM peptidoglycan-binding domain-containing M23 family metallopeptidase [Roseinatronobacter thiooxidans]PZX46672.1 murein DD-endopeptidase MepM/ murein hydrolase activator NlpD [Roseinatronobacter thiooxidans]
MLNHRRIVLLCSAATLALGACSDFDLDMRNSGNGFSTAEAARQATADRPRPDDRGIISYPDYQVAIARAGDTVGSVAQRIGMSEGELARFNALTPETSLRAGEVVALPRKLDGQSVGSPTRAGEIEISTLADSAISRAEGRAPAPTPPAATQPAEQQPLRHRVQRGETAFQIARLYNVAPRALADWNGLDPEMRVREGQMLLIPVADQPAPARRAPAEPAPQPAAVAAPGTGSATPAPPSASAPMPEPAPPAREAEAAAAQARPPSPELSQERSAPAPTRFVMPVDGRIIRAYAPGRNEHGIGIAASSGTAVRAAAAGRVAAITEDTNKVPVVVIQHDNGLLSVYAQLENLTVARGATVTQGQTIGRVRAGDPSFLHFEIRDGMNSVDPMRHLQ